MSLPGSIVLLSNPASGYNRRQSLRRISDIADKACIQHFLATTPAKIEEALREIAKKPPDILAVNGGDGTVILIASLMRSLNIFPQEPVLALIKGGTTNMIHNDCGLSGNPAAALNRLLTSSTRFTQRQPLEIRQDGNPPLQGFFFGAGAIPRAILATRATLHKWRMTGRLGEALAIGFILMRLRLRPRIEKDKVLAPSPFRMKLDTADFSGSYIFAALTSLNRLIGNRKVARGENEIGILMMGKDRKLREVSAAAVVLDIEDNWVLDGEFFSPGRLEIQLGAPLRFVTDKHE